MITVRGRIFGALLVAALLSSVLAAPAGAVEDETNAGFETVLRGTNDYRQASGRDRLIHDKALTAVAQAWAERMAADYAASRDINQAFRHNTSLSSQVPAGWQGLAENIAANMGNSTPYVKLLDQWKKSPGHNTNMLNASWTHIGVGTFQDNLGWTWGVQVFGDYGDPAAISNPVHAVVDLDNLSYSGTAACVVLVSHRPIRNTSVSAVRDQAMCTPSRMCQRARTPLGCLPPGARCSTTVRQRVAAPPQ